MAWSAKTTAYIYHHVVLPPKRPQQDDSHTRHEQSLFDMVIRALEELRKVVLENDCDKVASAIAMVQNLRDHRDGHGDVSEVQLETLLSALTVDRNHSPVPIEVKAQNAGILISRQPEHLTFEFFELSPTNEAVMRSTRLMRTFPGSATQVSVQSMATSRLQKSIASTISKMAAQSAPGFQPQAYKNGTNEDEGRVTTDPGLVTNFLMTLTTALGEAIQARCITKATREDVLWKQCKDPWRRSPLWLLTRVVLQLWFTRDAGTTGSPDRLYKAFMIYMVSQLLDSVCEHDVLSEFTRHTDSDCAQATIHRGDLSTETVHNVSAKLNRRVRKFEQSGQSDCLQPVWRSLVKKRLSRAQEVIRQDWHTTRHKQECDNNTAMIESICPERNLGMKLPDFEAFLAEMRLRTLERPASTFKPGSIFPGFSATSLPEKVCASIDDRYLHLAAFEDWIKKNFSGWISLHLDEATTCGKLRRLIEQYYPVASAAYVNNPVAISIMYLTIMELLIACDRSACAQYSLLGEYDPEICVQELQCFTLPKKEEMKRLNDVERYIHSRRGAADACLPSICRSFGHRSSFAVRYFEQSVDLQVLLASIERTAEKKREQKCEELRRLKEQYEKLMDLHNNTACDVETYVYNHYHGYTTTRHPWWCTRCSYKKQALGLKIHIYEWPVSSDTRIARATIFELQVPQAFSDWRDTCAYVINKVLGHGDDAIVKPSNSYTLDKHSDLSQLLSPSYQQRRIVPLSEIKPHFVTHRKEKEIKPHLAEDDVCLKNALKYAYFDTEIGAFSSSTPGCTEDVPKRCMYRVPKRSIALARFMYRPPSTPDGLAPNEVIVSITFAHLSMHRARECY